MLRFNGVEVWIESNGVPLEVYQTLAGKNKISCYIISEEGKSFSIHWGWVDRMAKNLDQQVEVFLDGRSVLRRLLRRHMRRASEGGYQRTKTSKQPFQFGRLQLTDDSSQSTQEESVLQELGSIRVNLQGVQVIGLPILKRWKPDEYTPDTDIGLVDEKLKVGRVHHAELGKARPYEAAQLQEIINYDVTGEHVYDFIFHYAPREWLQAKDYLSNPGGSTPASSSSSRSPSHKRQRSLSTSDSDDVVLLDPEEQATYIKMKEKIAAKKKARRIIVKKEEIEVPVHILNKVIDLTGDDSD